MIDLDMTLQAMGPEIAAWIETTTQHLQGALDTHISLGGKPSRTLMHLLQDLRGQAGSMGFPLASRAAAALYRLLEASRPAPVEILISHVDAIRAIISENARGTGSSLAIALVEALEEYGNIWITGKSGNISESSSGS